MFLCIFSDVNLSNYFKVAYVSESDILFIKTINNLYIRFLQKVDDFSLVNRIYKKFHNSIVDLDYYGHVSSWLYCPFEYIIFDINNIHYNKSIVNDKSVVVNIPTVDNKPIGNSIRCNNTPCDRKTSSNMIDKKYKFYNQKTFSSTLRKSTFFEVCGISS